jgi:outer membrane immunogenic protein
VKKDLLLGVALGTLAAVSPAMAQKPAPVVQRPAPIPAFSWTGFYAGINGGYSAGRGAFSYYEAAFGPFGLPTQINQTHNLLGGVAGIQGGYNLQFGSWVVGGETDFDWTGEKGTSNSSYNYPGGFEGATTNLSVAVRARLDWLGTTRARFGWLVTPTTLAYTTAGVAYGQVSVAGTVTDTACTPSCTWSFGTGQTRVGYAVGTGIEGAIPNFPGWTWRFEYLYVDLGMMSGSGFDTDFGGTYSWSEKITDNIFRVGVNLKLP